MNWLQLIERRASLRRYQLEIDEVSLAQVRKAADHPVRYSASYLKHHLVPGVQVQRQPRSLIPLGIVRSPWYVATVSAADRDSLFNLGYSSQHLVLQLTGLGLGTCWLGGPFDRQALGDALGLGKGLSVQTLIAWGKGEEGARTAENRRRLQPGKIAHLAGERELKYPWRTVLEAVRWAPSALNRQPWRLWFDAKAIHLYSRSGVIGRLFTPIDMGIALCHLELACKQLVLAGRIAKAEPPKHKNWEYWYSFLLD